MGTSPITPCYDVERLKTKTHVGVRPRGVNRIHQTLAEPSGPSVAWVLSRKVDTWRPYSMDRPSEGGA